MRMSPKVNAMVKKALKEDANTAAAELHARAKKISPSVGRMPLARFVTKYIIPVVKPEKVSRARGGGSGRAAAVDLVRDVLADFAHDLIRAEGREWVKVVAKIDKYADRAVLK